MSASAPPPRLGYRPALDGLRALAILLVVASHTHPTALKGGSLGVDVFFALSGFLITTLILQELVAGPDRYAFGRFYARRSLRLFPALYAVVAVVAVYLLVRRAHLPEFLAAADVPHPYPWTTWAKFVAGAATYTTDLIGVTATPGNLLGHTWSLAVEEQFYLMWPVLLVAVWRRRSIRLLVILLSVFIVACFAARVGGAPAKAGFLWTRPEAIAAGALAALIRWEFPAARASFSRFASPVVVVGVGVIGALALAQGHVIGLARYEGGIYSGFALVAAASVWAMVEVGSDHPARRLFEVRPAVYLGTISYGLYIWHVPLFRIVTWELPHLSGTVNIVLKVAVSVVAAVASARFVERPFRAAQARFRPATTVAAPADAGG